MGEAAQFWLSKLIESIQFQVRHSGYDRSIEVRNFAHMVSTGRGQDDEITRYRRYEADELKAQRKRLYNPLTKYAISRPRKQFKKVARVEGIRRNIEATDTTKLALLNETFGQFEPGMSLEAWLIKSLEFYGVTDPNAWIICERFDQRGQDGAITKITPYAFTVPSVDALDFARDNAGNLSYFLARTISIENVVEHAQRVEKVLENYYLYYPGGIARAREIGKNTEQEADETKVFIEVFPPAMPEKSGKKDTISLASKVKREFYVKSIENGTTEVPAICAGVYMDEVSGIKNVFVPWFDPAEHELKDLIRWKSTNDVISALHAYPKRWEFEKECAFQNEIGQCQEGYLGGMVDKEHICPNCKGTGFPANFTTEQASVKLLLPADADAQERILDLSKLSFVEPIDTAILELLDTRIERTERRILEAVFDSGLYQRPEGTTTKTATEVHSVMEGISDVLKPFCNLVSRAWELFYRVGAQYLEFEIKVDHEFPEDLQIQSLSDEVAVFNEMKDAGLGYDVLEPQRLRILSKVTEGNAVMRENVEAKFRHEPFAGKTPELVAQILAERSPVDPDRVLWENFEAIFTEVFNQQPEFYKMQFEAQKALVSQKTEEYKQRVIVAVQPEPVIPNFNEQQPVP